MHNRQIGQAFDLSFHDRYILAFEREDLPFISHLVLEVEADLDVEKIKAAFKELITLEPFARIVPDHKTGRFHLLGPSSIDIEKQIFLLDEEELENFWERTFQFPKEIALRLALVKKNECFIKIIFSFHHALYDGHAQFNFLKDFLDIYNGGPYQPRTLDDVYKYRKYFLKTTPLWYFKNVIGFIRRKKKKGKTKIARLHDLEPSSRKVDMELIELDRKVMDANARKYALSTGAFISLVGARAMDKILRERGDEQRPIVLYITKSMRSEFKEARAYQNLLGYIWMKIERDEIGKVDFKTKFRDTYKFRSGEEEVKKTLFLGAILVKLKSFSALKKILKFKEEKVHDCTLLVSSGRALADLKIPEEWKVARLYGKGSMHRSPGIGLLVTNYKQKDFICIEYLREAFKKETIARFKELLLEELNQE